MQAHKYGKGMGQEWGQPAKIEVVQQLSCAWVTPCPCHVPNLPSAYYSVSFNKPLTLFKLISYIVTHYHSLRYKLYCLHGVNMQL